MLKLGKQKAAELKLDQSRATQYYGDISQAPTGSQVKVDYSQNIKHMPQKK
ncbi:MAG: hypothetical protein NT051_05480 [Candidatus Micrarchaeota archaeon]|nr:hypothetical protein [Candidatus Micrarchaeota archaeon]